MSVYDYETAKKLLESNKRFKRRRLASDTHLQYGMDEGEIVLIFHKTAILTYYKDGEIEFDTGGWSGKATKKRMNEFQRRIKVWSEKKKWWYVEMGFNNFESKKEFYNGLRIKPNGKPAFKRDPKFNFQVGSENFGHLMKRY